MINNKSVMTVCFLSTLELRADIRCSSSCSEKGGEWFGRNIITSAVENKQLSIVRAYAYFWILRHPTQPNVIIRFHTFLSYINKYNNSHKQDCTFICCKNAFNKMPQNQLNMFYYGTNEGKWGHLSQHLFFQIYWDGSVHSVHFSVKSQSWRLSSWRMSVNAVMEI